MASGTWPAKSNPNTPSPGKSAGGRVLEGIILSNSGNDGASLIANCVFNIVSFTAIELNIVTILALRKPLWRFQEFLILVLAYWVNPCTLHILSCWCEKHSNSYFWDYFKSLENHSTSSCLCLVLWCRGSNCRQIPSCLFLPLDTRN